MNKTKSMQYLNTTLKTFDGGRLLLEVNEEFLLCVVSIIFLLRFLWLIKQCFYYFFKGTGTIVLNNPEIGGPITAAPGEILPTISGSIPRPYSSSSLNSLPPYEAPPSFCIAITIMEATMSQEVRQEEDHPPVYEESEI